MNSDTYMINFLEHTQALKKKWEENLDFIVNIEKLLIDIEENSILIFAEKYFWVEWDSEEKKIMICENGVRKTFKEHKVWIREKAFHNILLFIYKLFDYKNPE